MNPVEFVQDFYAKYDAALPKLLSGEKVTCQKGCSACCFQLIGVFPTEAINIFASMVSLGDDGLRDLIRRCFLASRDLFAMPNIYDCFRLHVPCVFLQNNLCQIYPWRPIVCRYYFCLSDPKSCSGPMLSGVKLLDVHHQAGGAMMSHVHKMVLENPEIPTPYYGPLPAMMVWAMATVYTGGTKRWAEKKLAKLPPIQTWHKLVARGEG